LYSKWHIDGRKEEEFESTYRVDDGAHEHEHEHEYT